MGSSLSDEQLLLFEDRLAALNLAEQFRHFIIQQRNLMAFPIVEKGRRDPTVHWEFPGALSKQRSRLKEITDIWIPGATWPQDVAVGLISVVPRGWHDQNKVALGLCGDALLTAVDPPNRRFDLSKADASDREAERLQKRLPRQYTKILRSWLPYKMEDFVRRTAKTQAHLELTRIGIALERHRLKHGSYPLTLEKIDPAVAPREGLPNCPTTGETAVYQRLPDDRFEMDFRGTK